MNHPTVTVHALLLFGGNGSAIKVKHVMFVNILACKEMPSQHAHIF